MAARKVPVSIFFSDLTLWGGNTYIFPCTRAYFTDGGIKGLLSQKSLVTSGRVCYCLEAANHRLYRP